MNLELVKTCGGGYYWFMDRKGVFLNSQSYSTDKDALLALISGTIKWDVCEVRL